MKKILPQCQYTQYWYDHGDKVTFMQDANLRTKNKYRFVLYDRMGRLCVQGLCDDIDRSANYFSGDLGDVILTLGTFQNSHINHWPSFYIYNARTKCIFRYTCRNPQVNIKKINNYNQLVEYTR